MINYLKEIFVLLGPDRRMLPVLVFVFIISSMLDLVGLGLIAPYVSLLLNPNAIDGFLGSVVDFLGLPREQQSLLILLGVGLVSIFLLKTISVIGIHWMIIRFSHRQQLRLRTLLMKAYQALPYTEYVRRNSSEYIHSVQILTSGFSNVVGTLLRSTCDSIVGLVILALLAWTNGPVLVLLVGLLSIVVIFYDRFFRKNLKSYGQRVNQASAKMVQGIQEAIDGLKEIRVLGHEAHFLRKVREGAKQEAHFQARMQLINTSPRYLLELLMISFTVSLVIAMLFLKEDIKTLLPTVSIFGVACLRLIPSANMLSVSLVRLRFSRDTVSRLHRDLEHLKQFQIESTKYDLNTKENSNKSFQSLELKNLSFRYTNAQYDALQDISIKISVGDSVGLIGPSGAGKTTLVDILLGLLEGEGSICYNRKPLQLKLSDWLAQAAYLPQQVFLIDNTLCRNVALGVEDDAIDENLLREAIRKARLKELVEQLPQGIHTLIGERGIRLSGGQRQRVALARAFYHGRNVLVMDEATSSLDHETEQEIVEEIKHLKGKITMIVIAHRLSTVKHCDYIYRLDKGRIVETGSPEQVLRKAG